MYRFLTATLVVTSLASTSCAPSPDVSSAQLTAEAGVTDAGVTDGAGGEAPPACDDTHPCAGSLTCCSGACVDTAHDPANCSACGIGCGAGRFCTGGACQDAVFAKVCDNQAVTVTLDAFPVDNEAGAALGAALAAACGPSVTVNQTSQLQPGTLEMDAGRPAVGGTLVAGGGYYGQLAVDYMDKAGLTPVYLTTDGVTARLIERATGTYLVSASVGALGAHHDFFFLELAVEPRSGTLCFFGAGILGPGTQAAGYYGSTQLALGEPGDAHSWYVYEWTDANDDGAPNAGDTFTLTASGP